MKTISIRNVKKKYQIGAGGSEKELNVLDGISLNIKKGEFIGILGPNGCGKTTLLKIMLGAEVPNGGEISIFGKSPGESVVGYVSQHAAGSLYPWLTASGNVAFAINSSAKSPKGIAAGRLSDFGIMQYANAFPYQLSGGLKQMVAIARATLASDVLVFDEPFSGVDYHNRMLMEQTLLALRDGSNTAVIVSHDIESALLLCDRIVVLSEKPARIKAVLQVSLPEKRTMEARFSQEFSTALQQVFSVIRSS